MDYNQAMLYGMYVVLIGGSIAGSAFKVIPADLTTFIVTTTVGHFFGVLTPSPIKPTLKVETNSLTTDSGNQLPLVDLGTPNTLNKG